MIRPVVRDVFFLRQKSEPATQADLSVGQDLRDTLASNRDRCVGMAANMIGVKKRVIIVSMGPVDVVMYNPVITRKDSPFETEEGCLSLEGKRRARRYRTVKLFWQDVQMREHVDILDGFQAQVVQHEIDHLDGIVYVDKVEGELYNNEDLAEE